MYLERVHLAFLTTLLVLAYVWVYCRSIIHIDSQNPVSISECHQGDEERKKFHQVYPPPSFDPKNKTEGHILLGEWDTENEKLGVILGVWKPLYPNPVSINKQ